MKKHKLIIALIVLIVATVCYSTISMADTDSSNKVEIVFKVGDSDLMINGNKVPVATPYVVNGTTLVPLRVISEAFGADIAWDGETKAVSLNYNGSEINLKIDSKTAVFNGTEMQLLEAPEIKGGSTMVPLRFITENFGATVNYDGQTSEVSVVKESTSQASVSQEDSSGLNMTFTKDRFGDSYYGWSMKSPVDMVITDKSFDGRYLYLQGEDAEIELRIINLEDDETDLDYQLDRMKNEDYIKRSTIIKSLIDTDYTGVRYAHVQSKSTYMFEDYKLYVRDNKAYILYTYLEPDVSVETRNRQLELSNYFTVSFGGADNTQNISNVDVNGYRPFSSKEYNVSYKIPKDWYDDSNPDKSNRFEYSFYSNEYTKEASFSFGVYSKKSYLSLTDWAKMDYAVNVELYNPSYVKASKITSKKIANIDCVSYTVEVSVSSDQTLYIEDTYAYIGDYGYNFSTVYSSSFLPGMSVLENIKNSIKIEPLEYSKTGDLQLNDSIDFSPSKNFKVLNNSAAISLPKSFTDKDGLLIDNYTLMAIGFTKEKNPYSSFAEFKSAFTQYLSSEFGSKTIEQPKDVSISGFKAFKFAVLDEDECAVARTWILNKGNDIYIITVGIAEFYVGGSMDKAVESAIKTFKLN